MNYGEWSDVYPFYGIPSVIAVNMIMAGASGGTTAIVIAMWAQVGMTIIIVIPTLL